MTSSTGDRGFAMAERKGSWGLNGLIVAFAALILAALWATTLNQIAHDRMVTKAAARQQAADLARAFDARLAERIERIDHGLKHIRREMAGGPGLVPGRLAEFAKVVTDSALIQIAVFDAQGRLVDSTLPHAKGDNFSDRDYYLAHRNPSAGGAEDRLLIGRPALGRISQRWTLHFSRRIESAEDGFLGVLMIAIDPFAFSHLADDLPIGEEGAVSIVGSDRAIRMIHTRRDDPLRRGWIGRELPGDRPQFDPTRPTADVVRLHSTIDARPFMVAYRWMDNQPLIVLVHLSETEIFGRVNERAEFLLTAVTGMSGIILLFAAGLAVLGRRQHRARLDLAAANHLLRENERVLEQRVAERTVALERSNRHVHTLAYHDTLTGLPNRTLFADRAAHALRGGARDARKLAILFLDLDQFKTVNDTLGHPVGDELLVAVAGRIRQAVRPADTVARMGGDEFVVIAEGIASANDAAHVAERIMAAVGTPLSLGGRPLNISLSIGIAVFPDDGGDVPTLLKNADTAMYAAKTAGRNTARFFSMAMSMAAEQRLGMELALRRALERQEFTLVYQPKIALASGRLCGVEALLRWRHPERGWVPPAEFIPFAEEIGLIEQLGAWVLDQACRAIAGWDDTRFGPLSIAVNVAAAQVNRGDLAAVVDGLTRQHRIDPGRLEIEVTETAVIADTDRALATLNRLRSLGVAVALDDFGTGYSSLMYLRRLDIDTIKIDRSFLMNAHVDSRDGEIVRLIIRMAQTLHLSVVAEGVETEEHVAFLKDAGCDMIQGYLVARPMPLADLQDWIAAGHSAGSRPPPKLTLVSR
ncbi:EAL domain-containing protein [Azospirillum doebereinerae]|uniref:bifunctional diguanylate cyclase/phosphodiesterase n=1 Tax=Azospirillum doebereinerae TaxID=92933 RepID=UPI001EE5BF74|nr:EAL domain-containing protein [Azospirillum doebereinerae]MCG5241432.1 EAL domain-containing protein [Azospirillum doebereinerae]